MSVLEKQNILHKVQRSSSTEPTRFDRTEPCTGGSIQDFLDLRSGVVGDPIASFECKLFPSHIFINERRIVLPSY